MPDVVVVGAGFAGLSAAAQLVDEGADVIVVEARPGLGGRACSFRDPGTGEIVDNGQHVLVGCYHETLRFLDRIGVADAVHKQTSLQVSMIDAAGVTSSLVLPPLPSPLHLLGGVLAWRALTMSDRLSLLRIAPALREASASAIADGSKDPPGVAADPPGTETVRAWLIRHGQSARLCELLWEPLALAALNQSIDQAAASHFVAVLARMFGPETSDAALVLPARPLTQMYADPAREWIVARGSQVRTQAPARVVIDRGMVRGVRVRDELIAARTVIVAVPWFALTEVFDAPPQDLCEVLANAGRTPGSPIVTVNLWLDRPVLDEPLLGLPGRTFQWVFDRRAIVGDEASHLSLVSSGAESVVDMTNAELTMLAMRELGSVVPALGTVTVRKASAVRERKATFSLAPGMPPRPSTTTSVSGLFLAGDWIDTGLPATIESAVVSGHWAAREAART
jgi:hydroxysqualene dehydroxylase